MLPKRLKKSLITKKTIHVAPFYSFWLRIKRSRTSLQSFFSDDEFKEKIIFENWAEDANLDDERFSHFLSLSDFKWKSASYLDNHGVLCETHKFSREPTTNICNISINSKYGALYGEFKLSSNLYDEPPAEQTTSTMKPTTASPLFDFPAGNLFERQSATEMKKCFQLVECGKQHPIMFIQITAFDFSLVSSTMIIKINPNTRSRYLETCQGLRLVAYDFHLLIIAVSPVLLRNVLLLLILI